MKSWVKKLGRTAGNGDAGISEVTALLAMSGHLILMPCFFALQNGEHGARHGLFVLYPVDEFDKETKPEVEYALFPSRLVLMLMLTNSTLKASSRFTD
jgi:hypothetical protein